MEKSRHIQVFLPNASYIKQRNTPPFRLEMLINLTDNILAAHELAISVKWNHESRFSWDGRRYLERVSGFNVGEVPASSREICSLKVGSHTRDLKVPQQYE